MGVAFFVGLHHPADAHHFERCMVSINVLEDRAADFRVNDWMLDSGAFSRISAGRPHMEPRLYAAKIARWSQCGNLLAAVSQDWMCEPFIVATTGLSVQEHQRLTIDRYLELSAILPGYLELVESTTYLLPVLQGYEPQDYVRHVRSYGNHLPLGAWVGVGSVCKRNARVTDVLSVLDAIHTERPDLRLHGFGLKITALADERVRSHLWSADSMAWSVAARKGGRDANDWREAQRYVAALTALGATQ